MAKMYLLLLSVATFLMVGVFAEAPVTVAYHGVRSTYDWGQHTQSPDQNGHQQGDQDQQGGLMWQHRCGGGQWTCAGAANLCVDASALCDGVKNCPGGEDEDATLCRNSASHQKPNGKPVAPAAAVRRANLNRFRGQGFMFSIRNLKIAQGSQAKLWNQDSDRHVVKSA